MTNTPELLKLRVLLSFLREDESMQKVTKLAGMLGEGKKKISRILQSLEREGLVDRSDTRAPRLTQQGRRTAEYYEERESVILNHLLYEGQDLDSAEYDACVMALYYSDQGMGIVRQSEQRYRAKYELRRKASFGGDTLCRHMKDGDYNLPFLIYKENGSNGSNLSMANEGFAHPCTLHIEDGVGEVRLTPVPISARSKLTGREMIGQVRNLQYFDGAKYVNASETEAWMSIPAKAFIVLNMGINTGQILHGSVGLKMQCSVGTAHMPESTAFFTFLI